MSDPVALDIKLDYLWRTSTMHTGELRVPKSQGRNCDQTSLNQDWKWKNGPRYINKGDYVAFCWKYISSICRKRKWIHPMSGKSYICANSAFTWFLKVHRIKFSERQTSLGSFCLILECRQIYSRQNCRTRVTSSGILLCNISELRQQLCGRRSRRSTRHKSKAAPNGVSSRWEVVVSIRWPRIAS